MELENWRGRSAWEKCKRELESKGEKLDWQAFVPPPVPNQSNFASLPIFAKLFDYHRDSLGKAVWKDTNAVSDNTLSIYTDFDDSPLLGLWIITRRTNLIEWQEYYRKSDRTKKNTANSATNTFRVSEMIDNPAIEVLAALSRSDDSIQQLRERSERSHARFPIHYEEGYLSLLPHLSRLKLASQNLSLRVSAQLALQQPDAAAQDVILNLRIANLTRDEPFLISHLVRVAMTTIALHPLWEGLLEQRWSDHHLKAFQVELGKFHFLPSYHLAIRGERAFSNLALEMMRTNRNAANWIINMDPNAMDVSFEFDSLKSYSSAKLKSALCHMIPDGWFYQNQASLSRSMQPMLDVVDPVAGLVSISKSKEVMSSIQMQDGFYPYNAGANLLLPAFTKVFSKMAFEQTAIDLAIVACAIERYRLANQRFPESLTELSPQFLQEIPHDVITGEPLKYHRTDDGKFILYSVGWNGLDDGGAVALTSSGRGHKPDEGDWVWRYSTNLPVAKPIEPRGESH